MDLPEWAERSFQIVKPQPTSTNERDANSSMRLDRWQATCDRFRRRWIELEPEKWKTAPGKSREATSVEILIAALDCAWRLSSGSNPGKVIQARKDLLELEAEISEAASKLASLFRLRSGIQNDTGVATWREQEFEHDPMDLWDALEMTIDPDQGSMGYANDLKSVFSKPLCLVRSTSQSVPEWPDLLDQLGERFEHGTLPGEFPPVAQLHDTNKSRYSPWCKALISMLQNRDLLERLAVVQLSALAAVTFDAEDDSINPKQMGDLKRAILKIS